MGIFQTIRSSQTAGKFFILYYAVGLVGLSLPGTRDLFIGLMPWSILGSMALLMMFHQRWTFGHVGVILLIALAGYLVEVLGVLTGLVFGEYSYQHALGLQVFDTPLMIGVNWAMLIYCVHAMLEDTGLPAVLKILTGAMLLVGYDFILEPVAIRLSMWSWGGGAIPTQNYIAWFFISVVFLSVMRFSEMKTGNRLATWLFWVQTAFFLLLNLSLRFLFPQASA
jgi:bisanhydrobacterioruberin hydratase